MSEKTHNLYIRLDKKTKNYIKSRASKNNRTLQQEVIDLIQKAEISDSIKSSEKIKH